MSAKKNIGISAFSHTGIKIRHPTALFGSYLTAM